MKENKESVNHPSHYQNEDPTYEVIKIIDAYDLKFCLGNAIKYILRSGKKNVRYLNTNKKYKEAKIANQKKYIEDCQKAVWYINHHIENLKKELESYEKTK